MLLGGVALNTVFALTPRLFGPVTLGERVTDSRAFTISLAAVVPEVTIVGYSAPSELNAGDIPNVTVNVRHNRPRYEWIFARIRDVDTDVVVAPMKRKWVYAKKEYTFTFSGVAPLGDWGAVMPNRDWNLRLEVGLWWL